MGPSDGAGAARGWIARARARWPVPDLSGAAVIAGVAIAVVALAGLAALQYRMPVAFDNPAGANPEAARHFEQNLWGGWGPRVSPLRTSSFVWTFRLLLMTSWAGYALALVAGLRGGRFRRGWVLLLVVAASLGYAVLFPPTLSRDSYAYVAFARMGVVYGENPYLLTLRTLYERGDPAASFHPVRASSTYGPVWTLVSFAILGCLRAAGLWWQVVGMKLVAGIANVAAALAAAKIAASNSPERSNLTLFAVGMNPLLLIEGPGNGHNDILMMALLLAGLALHARKKPLGAYVLVGLSVATKFVTAPIVPWLVLEQVQDRRPRAALAWAGLATALALAPTVAGFAPFWAGPATLQGFSSVYAIQTQNDDAGARPDPSGARQTGEGVGSLASGEGEPAAPKDVPSAPRVDGPRGDGPNIGRALLGQWPLALIYLGLSLWIWRARDRGRAAAAWVVFSSAMVILMLPVWFAWYLIWPVSVSLSRWKPLHVAFTLVSLAMSLWLLFLYTVPYP